MSIKEEQHIVAARLNTKIDQTLQASQSARLFMNATRHRRAARTGHRHAKRSSTRAATPLTYQARHIFTHVPTTTPVTPTHQRDGSRPASSANAHNNASLRPYR
ncbi:hypothetical protein [Ktedonospora formicarum]|uniref:hypothetical protein n=1 Tax=Ktedonospora formicarum TaxID=2778364 RepID=UPI001C68AA04|nr:hypothetical protein [Ktedonospora formicarum]